MLLVHQRGGAFAGSWLLPGGGIESGEKPLDAAVREVREETGCSFTQGREVAAYRVVVSPTAEQPDGADLTVHLFVGRVSGTVRPEEGSAAKWVDPRAIGLHPTLRRELLDAGLRHDDPIAIDASLRAAGIAMLRLR